MPGSPDSMVRRPRCGVLAAASVGARRGVLAPGAPGGVLALAMHVLAALVGVGVGPPASAQQVPASAPAATAEPAPQAPPTPQEWETALAAVRFIAVDNTQLAPHRANAVVAYARLQLLRGRGEDAIKTCKQVLDDPGNLEVAEAAVRAGCLVRRSLEGNVGGAVRLVQEWKASSPGAASKQALDNVTADLGRTLAHLAGLAGRRFPPAPTPVGLPPWSQVQPQRGPAVLAFPPPAIAAPAWLLPQATRGAAAMPPDLPGFTTPPWAARDASGIPRPLVLALPTYTAPPWVRQVSFPPLPPEPPKPPAAPAK